MYVSILLSGQSIYLAAVIHNPPFNLQGKNLY